MHLTHFHHNIRIYGTQQQSTCGNVSLANARFTKLYPHNDGNTGEHVRGRSHSTGTDRNVSIFIKKLQSIAIAGTEPATGRRATDQSARVAQICRGRVSAVRQPGHHPYSCGSLSLWTIDAMVLVFFGPPATNNTSVANIIILRYVSEATTAAVHCQKVKWLSDRDQQ